MSLRNTQTSQTTTLDGFTAIVNSTLAIDINEDGRINREDYML
jgi:hypothetical protein